MMTILGLFEIQFRSVNASFENAKLALTCFPLNSRHALFHNYLNVVMLRVRNIVFIVGSVADPRCLSRIRLFSIPYPNFFYPGSTSKNLNIFTSNIVF
jgi:hypothetical protein